MRVCSIYLVQDGQLAVPQAEQFRVVLSPPLKYLSGDIGGFLYTSSGD